MSSALLQSANTYASRGWSIIPMRGKLPAVRWKRYQEQPATPRHFRRWFRDGSDLTGLAVVFGRVSGNLGERDFDDFETYRRWSAEQPALAKTLPTVVTSRGRRVVFTVDPDELLDVRKRLGKTGRNGSIKLDNGELRADVGCYSVFPRSQHPSGAIYEWATALPAVIPVAPLSAFVPTTIDVTPDCDTCHESCCVDCAAGEEGEGSLENKIDAAIKATLPNGPQQRDFQIFAFVRHLKALPELAGKDPRSLEPLIYRWHQAALPFISTKPFEETRLDFIRKWFDAKVPAGRSSIREAFSKAAVAAPPACSTRYEQPNLVLLISFCRQLQLEAADRPFFLSCAKAEELFGVHRQIIWRWLQLLALDGVLELVRKGTTGRTRNPKASEYRYRGDL